MFQSSLALILCLISLGHAAEVRRVEHEIPLRGLDSASIELHLGAAQLDINTHDGGPLVPLELDISVTEANAEDWEPTIHFSEKDGVGQLILSSGEDDEEGYSILGSRKSKDHWVISLTRSLPIDLDVAYGLGPGQVELGGMQLRQLSFATGLSEVAISFETPCQGEMQEMELATGLGSMEVRGLSNVWMEKLSFVGGLGSATLSFDGHYRTDVDVTLDVGMGSLVLKVPESIGVKMRHDDSFLSNHDFTRLERISEDTWYSDNWQADAGNLDFDLSVGMGSVELNWIEP